MLINEINKIDNPTIHIPVIVRSKHEGWVPTFELWETPVKKTCFIACPQTFNSKSKNYEKIEYDSQIGNYNQKGDLVINWKCLIDEEDIPLINEVYAGKTLRVTSWPERYCTYFGVGSKSKWLHSVILDSQPGYVVHHIDNVSANNCKSNLHILPKREHDSIPVPSSEERKAMFNNPINYWHERKNKTLQDFIMEMSAIIVTDAQNTFLAEFAKTNKSLTIEILQLAKRYLNLSSVTETRSETRRLNSHLSDDYLDVYEIEKYLKKNTPKESFVQTGQLRMF